jgi:hypothetical protein
MDANIGSVVAFRKQGSDRRRRLAAGLVAAAIFALMIVVAWRVIRSERVEPLPTADMPAGWVRCTNGSVGYSIGYPGDWHTTDVFDGAADPTNACRWFSPDPFGPQGNLVSEGWGYPLELAITGPLDRELRQTLDPDVARTLEREDLVVDGHRAVRVEYETLVDVIAEPGIHYAYLIQLDPETTLIVHTTATRGIAGVYAENRVVVDRAVRTIRFTAPA